MGSDFPPIHFFKIIVSESLDQGKLMIPRKFVKKYGEYLPKAICLKTPNGADWKLRALSLVKSDGKIWFENGWKEFVDYHSLSHGHLLVFKYEKTTHFEVTIFAKSGLEISYPFKRVEVNNEKDCRASQKRKAYSSFEIGGTSYVKKRKGKHVNATLERAKSLKTCNPFFVLVMHASYIEHHSGLNIPSEFGRKHFDLDKKKGEIYFQVLDNDRVWSAKYSIGMKLDTTQVRFQLSRKWREFVKDNNLKVGDVCNFELIHKTNMTFQVHIVRKTDEVNVNVS
ncbi:B3 domain-containing protein At4g01580-like [Vicia villosa]|uniref:B3 domain-containing protein At4g01580-like n=1 Tax=Vicia villosa TaxID=3911 RepID=UPI00273C094C|nr:B3 domain-containing protein At4g01580-like [Vicia villosa]